MDMKKVKINTEYIKLDQLLKWSGIVGSGTEAKLLITQGVVEVNGNVMMQRGKKIFPGDQVLVKLEKNIELIIE